MRRACVLAVAFGLAFACSAGDEDGAGSPAPGERARVLGPFLAAHWELPVAPQGPPPAGFSPAEAALDPATCGACHPEQYAEWQTSFHARAFSPGFAGQLVEGPLATPLQVRGCQTCHTPLAEQQPFDAAGRPERTFDPELRAGGIVCASCHVRQHERFGPPRRAGLPPLAEPLPHGGFTERTEYTQSRFCAECHQFFDDDGANGKPLENTYREWAASPQAAAGRHCQNCHMPDRAHTWRGIHDPEMVRRGVATELVPYARAGDVLSATLVVANRDVGHAFPTYITPRVFVSVEQVDASGAALADTRVEAVIGREVDLGTMQERLDTRILPGESVRLDYERPRAPAAVALVGRVRIDPDFHYRGVFELLRGSYESAEARRLMQRAADEIADSAYELVAHRLALD